MKYFLVKGTVLVTEYLRDDSREIHDTRLVIAGDSSEAYTKYRDYWTSKSVDYDTSYYLDCISVLDTIE